MNAAYGCGFGWVKAFVPGRFTPGYYVVQFWYLPLTVGEELLATPKRILDLLAQNVSF